MKRRANDTLSGPPSKVFATFSKNFEHLELSICGTSVKVECDHPADEGERGEQNVSKNLTVDEIKQLDFRQPITTETFKQILLCIGPCVKNVRIVNGNSVILPKVGKHCKNLDSIELLESEGSNSLENIKDLTELKVPNLRIATHSFRKCLMNSAELASLEFDNFWYGNDVTDLPDMLPRLKRLRLVQLAMGEDGAPYDPVTNKQPKKKPKPITFDYRAVPQLLMSDELTHFSFESERSCNELLKQLSGKGNLQELSFKMNVSSRTFEDIGELKNLQRLSITNHSGARKMGIDPVWPPGLTCLTLNNIVITRKDLLSTLSKLDRLEELHIGTTNARLHPWLNNDAAIGEVDNLLRADGRIFKIFFSGAINENLLKYKSANLEIINECAVNADVKPLRIMISC